MGAFSTTSQLGLILTVLCIFNFGLIIFHIIFHAFSKAGIFISTGLPIHTINNFQDYRFVMFNFINQNLVFKLVLVLGSFSLMGVFRFCCFNSKEKLLFSSVFNNFNYFSFTILLLACFVTILYSSKLIGYTFKFSINNFKLLVVFNGKIFILFLVLLLILLLFGSFGVLINMVTFNFSRLF